MEVLVNYVMKGIGAASNLYLYSGKQTVAWFTCVTSLVRPVKWVTKFLKTNIRYMFFFGISHGILSLSEGPDSFRQSSVSVEFHIDSLYLYCEV